MKQAKGTMEPEPRILRNSARCRVCLRDIESKHRHDFVVCDCWDGKGNGIFIDGGKEYRRYGGDMENIIDTSIMDDLDEDPGEVG